MAVKDTSELQAELRRLKNIFWGAQGNTRCLEEGIRNIELELERRAHLTA